MIVLSLFLFKNQLESDSNNLSIISYRMIMIHLNYLLMKIKIHIKIKVDTDQLGEVIDFKVTFQIGEWIEKTANVN